MDGMTFTAAPVAADFVHDIADHAAEVDPSGSFPWESLDVLQRERVLGITARREDGGEDAGLGLIRQDRAAAGALTAALLEAQDYVAADPDGSAALFAQYSPTPTAQLAAMLRSHTHNMHATGPALKQQIAQYADELKLVHVMRDRTDTAKFAEKVFADVLTA